MILAIALAVWALAAVPIAITLGRLCRQTENTAYRTADHRNGPSSAVRGTKSADAELVKLHTV